MTNEEPLIGFASADNELFTIEFKKEGIIHPEYMTPLEWLPGARTVISFFLPFTKIVNESNRNKTDKPYEPDISQRCSAEWLHARIEGQIFLDKITNYIQALLGNEGFETVCPTTSGKCALGKDQLICGPYVRGSYLPPYGTNKRTRYGCGKCQCGVPCESGIPKKDNLKK